MDSTIAHANTFFFISSIGFIIVFILIAVALVYLIRLFKNVNTIAQKLERDAETIGEEARDFILDIRESPVLSFLFGRRKKKIASKKDKGV